MNNSYEHGFKITKKEVIEKLQNLEERDGVLMPSNVVEEARNEDSILHGYFNWDDTLAAELYRKEQARTLINHIKVTLKGKERDGFHSVMVTVNEVEVRGYVSAEKVAEDEDLRIQVKEAAIKEIRYWQKKYKDLDELSGIVNEDKLEEVESGLTVVSKD